MGILTLEQLASDAETRSRRTIDDTAFLHRLVNATYRQVAAADIPFKELEAVQTITTAASDRDYALPTDWLEYYTRGGRITSPSDNRARIRPMSREEYLLRTDYDDEGVPERFHVYASNVILYPTPDAVYTIELDYKKVPALLTSGQKSVLPDDWDEAIILGTIARIYKAFQETARGLEARSEFIDYVRERMGGTDRDPWSDTPLDIAWDEADLEVG